MIMMLKEKDFFMVCTKCKGSKVFMKIGGMKVECPGCLGVGYTKDEKKEDAGSKADNKRKALYKKRKSAE